MKIYALLLSLVITAQCGGQNKIDQETHQDNATITARTPKLVKPNVPNQWPYDNSVNYSLQDKDGNLWFATTQGVYRYDGKLFTNFKTMDGLSVDHILCITEDKDGNIWFGTKGGACKYDGKTFTSLRIPAVDGDNYTPFTTTKNNPIHPKSVCRIMQDKSGIIWLGVDGPGIYRYDGKTISYLSFYNWALCDSVEDQYAILSIFEDTKNNIWFSSGTCGPCQYLFRLDAGNANNPCINNTCKHDLTKPKDLAEHNKEIASSFTRITAKEGGQGISYTSILEDKTGTIWFGTWDSGVYRFDSRPNEKGNQETTLSRFSDKEGINTSYIISILEDKSGNIWFGTGQKSTTGFDGNGLYRYDGKTLTHFTTKDGLCSKGYYKSNSVSCMMEDNAGKIWFASAGGGLSCYDPVKSGTGGKLFANFSTKDGLNSDNINCMEQDKSGNLWFGTWELGVCRYDGKTFTSFTDDTVK